MMLHPNQRARMRHPPRIIMYPLAMGGHPMIILVGVLVAVYHAEVILCDDGVAEWLAAAHLHFQAHKQTE